MWHKSLDAHVTVHTPYTTAFLIILLEIPNYQTSIHVAIYLPTAGRNSEFLSDLANLRASLENLLSSPPDASVFIRGDSNVNSNKHFLIELSKRIQRSTVGSQPKY